MATVSFVVMLRPTKIKQILTLVDLSECATANLLDQLIVLADPQVH